MRDLTCPRCGEIRAYPRVWYGVVPPKPRCPYGCDDRAPVIPQPTPAPQPEPRPQPAPPSQPTPRPDNVIPFPQREGR